jgi:O-antigen ligase
MNIIKKINIYFLYSLPVFFVFFHNIADFLVSIISITFLISVFLKKIKININVILNDKILLFFLFFCLTLVLSSYLSEFYIISLQRSVPYFRFLVLVIACKYWLLTDEKSIFNIIKICSLTLLFVIFDLFYQYFNRSYVLNSDDVLKMVGRDIFGYQSIDGMQRLQGPFGKEFIAGGYVARFSPFIWFLSIYFFRPRIKNNFFYYILVASVIILTTISCLITGDRSPFILMLLSIFLFLLLWLGIKIRTFLIFFSILLTLIGILYFSNLKKRFITESLSAIGFESKEFNLDTGYGHLFYSAYKIWLKNPFLGAGTKNYRMICDRDQYNFISKKGHQLCSTHPHNYLLELLSEVGLIGLLFFYLIFYSFYKTNIDILISYSKRNLKSFCIINGLNISLFTIIWPITTTGSIITNRNSLILWFLFGVLFSYLNFLKNQK